MHPLIGLSEGLSLNMGQNEAVIECYCGLLLSQWNLNGNDGPLMNTKVSA